MNIIKEISRSDTYYIIVPIIVAILPYMFKSFTSEKQWRYIKEKSSCDSVLNYFTKMILSGMLFLILYIVLIFSFSVVFAFEVDVHLFKISYVVWYIICYSCVFFRKRLSELIIDFRFDFKYKDTIKIIIYKVPIVFSGIMWTGIVFDATLFLWKVIVILMIVFEILIIRILNEKGKSKYNRIKFHFYNKTTVENIDINKIKQDGNWIIANKCNENTEYRFRIKDIQKVEYYM